MKAIPTVPSSSRARPAAPVSTVILGTGSFAPAGVLTNAELSQRMDTSDEWIRSRSGIERRHFAAEGETTSDLATHAARAALAHAGGWVVRGENVVDYGYVLPTFFFIVLAPLIGMFVALVITILIVNIFQRSNPYRAEGWFRRLQRKESFKRHERRQRWWIGRRTEMRRRTETRRRAETQRREREHRRHGKE